MNGTGRFPLPIVAVIACLFLSNILSELDEDLLEDFPVFALIAAFVLYRIFSSQSGARKKAPRPVPKQAGAGQPADIGFEIPPLRGAPKQQQSASDVQEAEQEPGRQQSFRRHLAEKKAREEKVEQERLAREHQKPETKARKTSGTEAAAWCFSPDVLRNAIVWSEVLAPPKALRRR